MPWVEKTRCFDPHIPSTRIVPRHGISVCKTILSLLSTKLRSIGPNLSHHNRHPSNFFQNQFILITSMGDLSICTIVGWPKTQIRKFFEHTTHWLALSKLQAHSIVSFSVTRRVYRLSESPHILLIRIFKFYCCPPCSNFWEHGVKKN